MIRLLKAPAICDKLLDYLPVHQRLSAKEIYFQINSASGIFHEKIKRFLSDFKAHKSTPSVILPFFCKAVFACQITVMGNVQTKRLNDCLAVLKIKNIIFINVFRKKHSCFF